MDSINQQQEEKNREDLFGKEASAKIKEMAKDANTCFFCTGMSAGKPMNVRPMSIQKADEEGNFWFLSASDSHKNLDIQNDPGVHLLFQGSKYSDFLSVYGHATITTDKEVIKELWEPILKTWFTEGIDDPRITAIKVETREGYYWDNKHGNAIAFAKTLIGAAVGKTMDDSIEGKLVKS
ncbi:pyridoxamine 5'-phosphate oxidase family protein [Dyadobacter sp. CY323]|uniref:pyridoxamine 5'-phosphate oxidase family protein n=1 Tax=Dyadobacter sp. CY323 TaxID=2907302 RepID=UPI001F23592F|nr:pyridoxamine 5'-phosphate oxidase family protein [Dyadobacter sp. CY323]MCE6987969.1 pyridoxamine 5'-phosphate oxidase family protein [Dyadobacter sp. CY323]